MHFGLNCNMITQFDRQVNMQRKLGYKYPILKLLRVKQTEKVAQSRLLQMYLIIPISTEETKLFKRELDKMIYENCLLVTRTVYPH